MTSPLIDLVITQLRDFIAQAQWRGGGKLPPEIRLAKEFGVSRPILRHALEALRQEGLVESRRGSGNFVRPPRTTDAQVFRHLQGLDDLASCFDFRAVIESAAAFEAAHRPRPELIQAIESACRQMEEAAMQEGSVFEADFAFHLAVARASRNPYFAATLEFLRPSIETAYLLGRQLRNVPLNVTSSRVATEHRQILKAIQGGDPQVAQLRMFDHIRAGRNRLFGRNDS